jgi:P4 family phage/plasmid primase-like protien
LPGKIPSTLIQRLRGLGPHFVRVVKRGKEPIDKGWTQAESMMSGDDPRLQAWLKKGGNYGVAGGYGVVILDADTQEIKRLIQEKLPRTFTVQSPGSNGWHSYFLCGLEKAIRLRDKEGENVGDIQGPGKMVVGPGSIHPNGGIYQIIDDRPLAQVKREQLVKAFKDFVVPEKEFVQVLETARRERKRFGVKLDILQVVSLTGLCKQGAEYFGSHPVHGSKTGRNFWINPIKNCWYCFRHGTGGGPFSWIAVEEGIIKCEDAKPGALRGPVFKQVLEKARERGLIEDESTSVCGIYFDGNDKFIPKLLADDIMSSDKFITLMNRKIYVWENGYYQPRGEVLIEQRCEELLQEEFRKHRFSEVAEYIRASTFTVVKEPPRNLVNIENGILNILTGELTPQNPDYHFFNKLPAKYDPDCKGERVRSFLREVTSSKEDAQVLEEMVGYSLYRGYPYHKALALVGDGANGKSTFLALVKEFLGRENVSGKGLVGLEINRFAKASLFGKLANIYADLSDNTLQRTGTFKMLTGGDVIEAEKKFRDSFTFVNYAKLLFSCNKLPEVYDNTDAFFRRWIIVVFPRVFKGDDCDPNILEKLTTPDELSGLLNIALNGLKRILENEGFSRAKSTEETREDYIRKSDPLAAFIMDCIEEKQSSILLKQQLYSLFAFYCRENNLPAVNKGTFFKNMPKHVTVTQVRVNRKDIPGRPYGFKGITLTEPGKKLWSKQSNQSGVSHILLELEDGVARKYNKIGKTLDSLDPLDRVQVDIDKAFYPTCCICHQPIPILANLSNVKGKPAHKSCVARARKHGYTQTKKAAVRAQGGRSS